MIRLAVISFVRLIVLLRYRIRIHGWPQVRDLKKPILLLPNHPGLIDPIIIASVFYPTFRPRTVLYEGNFTGIVRKVLVRFLRAISIPDLSRPSHEAHQRTEQAIQEIIAGLRRGENIVMWPAGRAERDGTEHMGAARALSDVLREVPEATVLLIRTRGVWGSMLSVARTGKMPRLFPTLLNGALILLANLLFFAPRRNVDITIEEFHRDRLPSLDRNTVNRWFEQWYNPDGPETPTFVPYHFLFGPRSYEFPRLSRLLDEGITANEIRPKTRQAIGEILSD